MHAYMHRRICASMLTTALFVIAPVWKQYRCPVAVEWIKCHREIRWNVKEEWKGTPESCVQLRWTFYIEPKKPNMKELDDLVLRFKQADRIWCSWLVLSWPWLPLWKSRRSREGKGASGRRLCPFPTVGGENLAGEGVTCGNSLSYTLRDCILFHMYVILQ